MNNQPVAIEPWKDLAPKQKELMRLCRYKTGAKKLIGVFGTRISGKTVAAMNCIADHLWTTKDAEVLIICRTQGDGTTGGVWNQLTEKVLPRWMEFKIGDEYMTWAPKGEPRATVSKKMICSVTNMHGGTSKVMLDSLDDEREVEKYKSRSFTMIYWSEAGEFKDQRSLTTFTMCLRGVGYAPDDFVMLIDANPPDEGQDHFLFEYFYNLRLNTNPTEEQRAFQQTLHLTVWSFADNPYLTDGQKNEVKGMYMNDPELYDRYCRGLWVKATRDAIFADVFKPSAHVLDPGQNEMMLLPTEDCMEMFTSHDAGYKNPVTYFCQMVNLKQEYLDKDQKPQTRMVSKFLVVDELAYIGIETPVKEFVKEQLKIMDKWEAELGRKIKWTHYSDRSALDFGESISNRTVADEMFAESEGRIKLVGVEKGKNSVEDRVRLTRKLLMEDRLYISGLRCKKLIESFQALCWKRINGVVQYGKIQTGNPFKHPWDAISYGVSKLCKDEIDSMNLSIRRRALKPGVTNLVNVRL